MQASRMNPPNEREPLGAPEALFAALDTTPPMSDEDAQLIQWIIETELRQVDPADWEDIAFSE
jgi:hypothetical protein